MAKLRVSTDLIISALFQAALPSTRIVGASYEDDGVSSSVVLEIEGPTVPDVDYVQAIITQHFREVDFKPIEEH